MCSYIIFDGGCSFCNKTISFIANKDINNRFKFVSNSSSFGNELLDEYNIKKFTNDTIILIENTDIYFKSMAIRKILFQLPKLKLFSLMMHFIPIFVSDWGYQLISRNRKKINQKTACEIPDNQIRKKFIV